MQNQKPMPISNPTGHRLDRAHHSGFTLLEVVISLFLMGILSAFFGMGIVGALQSYEFGRTNSHIAQKAHLAMGRMSRELMELTNIVAISTDGNSPFIIYERMVDGNSTSMVRYGIHHHRDGTGSFIRLYTNLSTDTTHLDSGTINQGDLLIDNVDTLSLALYLGQDLWQSPTSVPDIQLLSSIELSMTLNRPDRPGTLQTFENRIHLRNTNNFGGAAPTISPVSRGDYNCFISTLFGKFTL